jgi:hypothetical protein
MDEQQGSTCRYNSTTFAHPDGLTHLVAGAESKELEDICPRQILDSTPPSCLQKMGQQELIGGLGQAGRSGKGVTRLWASERERVEKGTDD